MVSTQSLRKLSFKACCQQIEKLNEQFNLLAFLQAVFNQCGFCDDQQKEQVRGVLRASAYWFLRKKMIIDRFPSEELLKIVANDEVLCDEITLIELAQVCAEDLDYQRWYAIGTGTLPPSRKLLLKFLNLLNSDRIRTLKRDSSDSAKETLVKLCQQNGIRNGRGYLTSYLPRMENRDEVVGIFDLSVPWSPTRSLEVLDTAAGFAMESITFQVNRRRLLRWVVFSLEVGTNSQEREPVHLCHCSISQSDCNETMYHTRGVFDGDIFFRGPIFPVFKQVVNHPIDYFELLPGIQYTIKITTECFGINSRPAFSNVSIRRLKLRY